MTPALSTEIHSSSIPLPRFPLSQAIPVLLKSCRVAKYYLSFVLLTIRPDAKSCHGGALGINLGNQTHLSSADPLEDPADHLA